MPSISLLLIFTVGTILMRSAGCAVNDWADREFDAHVKRTATRPLATGEIAPWEALVVGNVLAFVAFLFVLGTNRATILLSLPAVVIAFVYPFFKRFFALPQAFLGIAFSFGIPMAYAAVYDSVPLVAWGLLALNLFWVIAYDTEYAMVDRDDDVRLGLRTSAIAFGRADVAAVMICYAVYLVGMAYVGWRLSSGPLYYAGLVAAAACAVWHWWLIRQRDRDACFKAFLHNHWLGFAVFAGIAADLRGATRVMAAGVVSRGRSATARAGTRRATPGLAAAAAGPRLRGLPPVLGRDARLLILGSFPGEASLAASEYYAHPRNHFWPLLGAVLDAPLATLPYRGRLARLRRSRIALWDVIVACERKGSLDGSIRNAERGDIARVRRAAPSIALVCFNGKSAARAEPAWREAGYATLVLPSSSPAYTRPFAEKLVAWHAIGAFLRRGG